MRKSERLRFLAGHLLDGSNASEIADVIPLACETLTIGALARGKLNNCGNALPEDMVSFFQEVVSRNRMRNCRLLAQLEEAATALNEAGIVPILQKGIALLVAAPHTVETRMNSDLDLIVPKRDFATACMVLSGLGYRRMQVEARDPSPFGRERDVGMIDLHSAPRGSERHHGNSLVALHSQVTKFGRSEVLVPSPTLQLLYLFLHDQFHDLDYFRGNFDLRHALDIVELVEGATAVEWGVLNSILDTTMAKNALASQMYVTGVLFRNTMLTRQFGTWPARIQHARIMLQLDHAFLAPLMSVATAVCEFRLHWFAAQGDEPKALIGLARRRMQRLFRQRANSKV